MSWKFELIGLRLFKVLGLTLALYLLSGCATVPNASDNKPLVDFSESIKSLKTDTEKAFAGVTTASEKRFKARLLKEVAAGEFDALDNLIIKAHLKTLTAKQVPDFLKLQRLKAGVNELNSALVDYAGLLTSLSDPNIISADTFDKLATNLNKNVLAAAPSIQSVSGKSDTGLFSAMAMSLTENYLKTKQSGLLVKAIRSNQPTVQDFSKHLQKGVKLIAHNINIEYLHQSKVLKKQLGEPKGRDAAADQLITLNKTYFTDLQTLKRIHQLYGRLPLLHAKVADVIVAGNRGLSGTVRMLEETAKIKEDYDKTLAPGAPNTSPAFPANPAPPATPAPTGTTG